MGVVENVTKSDVKSLYGQLNSLASWLPWGEFLPETNTWVLEDDLSAGLMFEVVPTAVEARGDDYVNAIAESLQNLLSSTMPQENPPYILTVFAYDENNLEEISRAHREYVLKHSTDPRYAEFRDFYLDIMDKHFRNVSTPDGYFTDRMVTKQKWAGVTRRVKCFLYRRLTSLDDVAPGNSPDSELNGVYDTIEGALTDVGVACRRQGNKELYEMLFPWFNQNVFEGMSKSELLAQFPYPEEGNLPFGRDLRTMLFLEQPESQVQDGCWFFGGNRHKALTVDNLRSIPKPGQVSAELQRGDKFFAMLDKMPADTMLVMSIVFLPKELVELQVSKVKGNSRGEHHEAKATLDQADRALAAIASGDNLFPTVMSVLTQASDSEAIRKKSIEIQSLMVGCGFSLIKEKDDLLAVNQYIKAMPFNYEFAQDKDSRRSRLVFASHLANILPFYGRSRGTSNPGVCFFNRGAEDLVVDFIKDRINNAFLNIIGPPGSGKSSLLNVLIWYLIAVHNARIFILEKGGTFELTGELAREKGLEVNQVTLKLDSNYALSPFADAVTLALKDIEEATKFETEAELELREAAEQEHFFEFVDDEEAKRDYLGEMELSARIMITGGEEKEEQQLMRSDRVLIRNSIRRAGVKKYKALQETPDIAEEERIVLPEDVAAELRLMGNDERLSERARDAAERMSESMMLFCDGVAGQFFNRPGKNWEEADITVLEFGILAGEGYEAELALAFTSLMNRITYLVERDEHSSRPTVVIGDEAHLFLPNPILAIYLVKLIKMYRKLGTWLWLGTQNMDDYSDVSNKLLSMFEWLIAMTPPKKEIDAIEKIRDLTADERSMLRAARKDPGKFTEGVILSDQMKALFRSVPPAEIFALGLTEKEEKAKRKRLMKEKGISSNFEAALEVAKELAECRG